MALDKKVKISNEFIRSINLVDDQNNDQILDNFILTHSSKKALTNIADHCITKKQSSFTWTGPYGSGKSVLALYLNYLCGPENKYHARELSKVIEKDTGYEPFFSTKRNFIPIVGSASSIINSLAEKIGCKPDTNSILNKLKSFSKGESETIIVIDEMGKFLEYALQNKEFDIYIFQQIAEIANRSSGKLIFIGILHQSFLEYARHLTKSVRDEWSKIQGRYIDLSINAVGEEQIQLISKAIVSELKPSRISSKTRLVTKTIAKNKPVEIDSLNKILNNCWPLHPVVAGLLGPISRKRFGQNQRSIFSFLSSAETFGFNHFISNNTINSKVLYSPIQLWDYLEANFSNAIIASPDSSIWNLANESISRASVLFNSSYHQNILKVISLINIFKGNSGIEASKEILESIFDNETDLEKTLNELVENKLIKLDDYKSRYSLFEGSDFDIDSELDTAKNQIGNLDFEKLNQIAEFEPIIAKKFYHDTGSLRWMKINFVESISQENASKEFIPDFSIIVPSNEEEFIAMSNDVIEKSHLNPLAPIAVTKYYNELREISFELLTLEWIQKNSPSLSGDKIARKEISNKINIRKHQLHKLAEMSLIDSDWFLEGENLGTLTIPSINSLASKICTKILPDVPIIKSEILNKDKPSGSANTGLNVLLKRMVLNQGELNLGIEGYPLEMGLFKILLDDTGIYGKSGKNFVFKAPSRKDLKKLWDDTDALLSTNDSSTEIIDVFNFWSTPPYGIKRGLFAFLSLTYIITRSDNIAVYLNDTYVPQIDDLVVDYLIRSPKDISLKFIKSTNQNKSLLLGVHKVLLNTNITTVNKSEANAFNLAKSLVQMIERVNPWVLRTRRFDKKTTKLRESIKKASDPNKLIYEDIKEIYGNDNAGFSDFESSLLKIIGAYEDLLSDIGNNILSELNVGLSTPENLENLRARAKKVSGISGDFRVDALSSRLTNFESSVDDIAGIASLAANKPINDWIDQDIERALIEISVLCEGMKKAEIYANVDGNRNRHSFSYASSLSNSSEVKSISFDILEKDRKKIEETKKSINELLKNSDAKLALAALTEIGNEKAKEINE